MQKFPSLESYEGYVEFNLQMPILLSVNVLPQLNVKKTVINQQFKVYS